MTITEALKSTDHYVLLQTADGKKWMYWDNISGYWIVKKARRGNSLILAQTRNEEEAIGELLKNE